MKAIEIITKALENRSTNKGINYDIIIFVLDNPELHKSIIENKDNYTDLIHDIRGLMSNLLKVSSDVFFVPRVLNTEIQKANKLLDRYFEVKDDLLEFTDEFHDSMLYDIEGYSCEGLEAHFNEELETQVKSFEMILKGYKNINYIFG